MQPFMCAFKLVKTTLANFILKLMFLFRNSNFVRNVLRKAN